MKKSIFLFFAAILCAMSANAATYLAGTMNGWSSNNSSYEFTGNPLTLNVELLGKTYYEFKIVADGSWKGNSGTINNSISNWAFNGGDNCKLNTNFPGVYKFVWNSGKLSVTYPEAPAPHDITVRAKVPTSWTNVKAWVWTSENGEGTEITPEKEGDYYVVTKNAGVLFVIYKNGTGWNNGAKNQTVDLCYTEDVCLQINQSGNANATATVIECGAVAKDITVKAVVPEAWGNNVWAHVWETGASGTDVKLTEKEGNWYVYTKNCLELNIIFKSGEGWDNIEQTADIKGIKENTCYSVSSINKTDGKCNVTEVDCDATIEPEVKPEDIYTVVGSSAELGLEWDPAKEANDMEKQDDGSYKKVYSNVELTSDVEWKIAKNDNWWNETPLENKADNGNSVLVIAKSGIYNVTFTLSADLKTAHAEAELLEETNTVADCFVSGNAALTGGAGWAGNEFKMEYDPATETYSYTLTGLAAETAYELQVVLGGNWYGYEKLQTIPTGVENKEGHIAFTLTEAGDVTVTYHVTNGINLTGNFALPVTYDYYLTGTLVGGWSAKQQGMEKDGELYKATFTELNAGTYQFKITDGQFNTEEDKTHEHTTLAAEYKEVSYVDGNIQFVTEEAKNITVIFDATANKITIEGLTIVTHTYTIAGDVALCGSEWDAEDPNNEMTLQDDGTYVWTATGVTLSESVEFKVIEDHNWEKAWPVNNYVIEIGEDKANTPGTYDVNIYFNAAEAKADNTTGIYVVLTPATIEVTEYIDITMTDLQTEDMGGILALMGSETEVLGLSVMLFLNDYTGENQEYQLNEESYLAKVSGWMETELPFVSGSMTKSSDATYGDVFKGTVIVSMDDTYYGLNITMYKKPLPNIDLTITGANVVIDLWNGVKISTTHDSKPVLVEFSSFEYTANNKYYDAAFEMGDWETDDTYFRAFAAEADVTISGNTLTLKGSFEATDAIYNLTISGAMPLVVTEGDNTNLLAQNGQTADAYITRTFESGNLYTVSFPFAMNETTTKNVFGSRVEVYEYTSLTEETDGLVLNFTKLSTPQIAAGTPYLVKPNRNAYGFGLSDVTISNANNPVTYTCASTTIAMEPVLTVAAEAKTNGKTQYWLAEDNNLYNKSVNLKGLRAIFNVQTNKSNVRARAAFNENVETGVEDIFSTDTPVKVIVNGQLIIIRDGEMYNVQGQLVK